MKYVLQYWFSRCHRKVIDGLIITQMQPIGAIGCFLLDACSTFLMVNIVEYTIEMALYGEGFYHLGDDILNVYLVSEFFVKLAFLWIEKKRGYSFLSA